MGADTGGYLLEDHILLPQLVEITYPKPKLSDRKYLMVHELMNRWNTLFVEPNEQDYLFKTSLLERGVTIEKLSFKLSIELIKNKQGIPWQLSSA